jgi:hypothetical protein
MGGASWLRPIQPPAGNRGWLAATERRLHVPPIRWCRRSVSRGYALTVASYRWKTASRLPSVSLNQPPLPPGMATMLFSVSLSCGPRQAGRLPPASAVGGQKAVRVEICRWIGPGCYLAGCFNSSFCSFAVSSSDFVPTVTLLSRTWFSVISFRSPFERSRFPDSSTQIACCGCGCAKSGRPGAITC